MHMPRIDDEQKWNETERRRDKDDQKQQAKETKRSGPTLEEQLHRKFDTTDYSAASGMTPLQRMEAMSRDANAIMEERLAREKEQEKAASAAWWQQEKAGLHGAVKTPDTAPSKDLTPSAKEGQQKPAEPSTNIPSSTTRAGRLDRIERSAFSNDSNVEFKGTDKLNSMPLPPVQLIHKEPDGVGQWLWDDQGRVIHRGSYLGADTVRGLWHDTVQLGEKEGLDSYKREREAYLADLKPDPHDPLNNRDYVDQYRLSPNERADNTWSHGMVVHRKPYKRSFLDVPEGAQLPTVQPESSSSSSSIQQPQKRVQGDDSVLSGQRNPPADRLLERGSDDEILKQRSAIENNIHREKAPVANAIDSNQAKQSQLEGDRLQGKSSYVTSKGDDKSNVKNFSVPEIKQVEVLQGNRWFESSPTSRTDFMGSAGNWSQASKQRDSSWSAYPDRLPGLDRDLDQRYSEVAKHINQYLDGEPYVRPIEIERTPSEKASSLFGDIKNKLKDVKGTVEDKFSTAKDKVEDKFSTAKDRVENSYDIAKDKVQDTLDQAKGKLQEVKEKAQDKFEDAKDKVEDKFDSAKDSIRETTKPSNRLKEWKQELEEDMQGIQHKIVDKTNEFTTVVRGKKDDLKDDAKGAAKEVKGTVSKLKDKIKDEVEEIEQDAKSLAQKAQDSWWNPFNRGGAGEVKETPVQVDASPAGVHITRLGEKPVITTKKSVVTTTNSAPSVTPGISTSVSTSPLQAVEPLSLKGLQGGTDELPDVQMPVTVKKLAKSAGSYGDKISNRFSSAPSSINPIHVPSSLRGLEDNGLPSQRLVEERQFAFNSLPSSPISVPRERLQELPHPNDWKADSVEIKDTELHAKQEGILSRLTHVFDSSPSAPIEKEKSFVPSEKSFVPSVRIPVESSQRNPPADRLLERNSSDEILKRRVDMENNVFREKQPVKDAITFNQQKQSQLEQDRLKGKSSFVTSKGDDVQMSQVNVPAGMKKLVDSVEHSVDNFADEFLARQETFSRISPIHVPMSLRGLEDNGLPSERLARESHIGELRLTNSYRTVAPGGVPREKLQELPHPNDFKGDVQVKETDLKPQQRGFFSKLFHVFDREKVNLNRDEANVGGSSRLGKGLSRDQMNAIARDEWDLKALEHRRTRKAAIDANIETTPLSRSIALTPPTHQSDLIAQSRFGGPPFRARDLNQWDIMHDQQFEELMVETME